MRQGMMNEGIIVDENKKFIGFSLGADFTAEHEWGIKQIRNNFGMVDSIDNKPLFGIKSRTIKRLPESYIYKPTVVHKKKKYSLITSRADLEFQIIPGWKDDAELTGYWCESCFGLISTKTIEMKELDEAFKSLDIVIMVGGRQMVFDNGGLMLLIASRIPKKEKTTLYDADKDYLEMTLVAKETGIEELLRKAKKEFFALSPRWKDNTKKEVIFWLNPMHQNIYDSRWCTVNDLKEWIENKGPIVKISK